MNKIDYNLIEENFFNTYQTFINFLRLTRSENSVFNIFILRKPIEDNITNIIISIENNDNKNQKFINSIELNNEQALRLVDNIRIDFKENHYISYSSVNQREYIQTLQNTNFTLKIQLIEETEIEEAIKFNNRINCNKERHKALTRV